MSIIKKSVYSQKYWCFMELIEPVHHQEQILLHVFCLIDL